MSIADTSQHLAQFAPADLATLELIERLGQQHLLENWHEPGQNTADQVRLLAQVRELDARYPGGLKRYLENAARQLEQSRAGESPYKDYTAQLPAGFQVDFASPEFQALEAQGLVEANCCGFVLVAGGLGERLGYPGIKAALALDAATGTPFLQAYVKNILALQRCAAKAGGVERQLPLAIMTSDETHEGTRSLLRAEGSFGMGSGQIVLLKQERVAGIADPTPRLALNPSDPYELLTKPHGHGDVHTLLHQTGVARLWLEQGIQWIFFFQDTNVLTFKPFLAALGVSAREHLDVNSLAVPRIPGEAVGGLVRLVKPGSELTVNVEYNQLDDLLRAAPDGKGDVPDHAGYSPYPGNINVLILALGPYVGVLEKTGGIVPEFINPKYVDETRTSFKSATRLECMMQDYPRLAPGAHVGFTQFERAACFSPVKNSLPVAAARQAKHPPLPPESASTAEADLYAFNRRLLQLAGAQIEEGLPETYQGVTVVLSPVVLISPGLNTPVSRIFERVKRVRLSHNSALLLEAEDLELHGLALDGALEIRAVAGARIIVRDLVVTNRGWVTRKIPEGGDFPPELTIRGYYFDKRETLLIQASKPGEYIVDASRVASYRTEPERPGYQVVSL